MTQNTAPAPNSVWNRVPVVIKAIATGFLVSTIGITIWMIDLAIGKASAWSMVLMILPLWFYWKYFRGAGWPKSNSDTRIEYFRLTNLSPLVWKWGLIAGLLFVVIVQSSFVVTFRLIELPDSFSSQYKMIDAMPTTTAWIAIIMASLVAGVCEEVGFRGYMQVPLEKKYGPGIGIIFVSAVFTLVHLDRSWSTPILPHIFLASVLLGILAYKTKSLIPGVIGHTILDVFDYAFWWTSLMGKFKHPTIFVSGIDGHVIVWALIFISSTAGFFFAIRKLR